MNMFSREDILPFTSLVQFKGVHKDVYLKVANVTAGAYAPVYWRVWHLISIEVEERI